RLLHRQVVDVTKPHILAKGVEVQLQSKGILVSLVAFALSLQLAPGASAAHPYQESFHEDYTFVADDFCGEGLAVKIEGAIDGRLQAQAHGSDQLVYFLEVNGRTEKFTVLSGERWVTAQTRIAIKDLKVTDNGDGALTIVAFGAGNDVFYGQDGRAIGRNPGQLRWEIVVDNNGTPQDPWDDGDILSFKVLRESTGRNDDFCEVVVPALTG
ncbi:MAG: hypothetical protein OEV62_01785, partial [Actinomycetota bacterium]|nr:hypothetical protein [Actinomycetota bacterium]